MKKIRLYIEGEPFVIEECLGEPEIRREGEPKACADRRSVAYVTERGHTMSVSIRVEGIE